MIADNGMLYLWITTLWFGLQVSAEPSTEDILACHGPLQLECGEDQVVGAEIYTASPSCGTPTSGLRCACATESRDCLTQPLTLVTEINNCRWKKSSCRLYLMPPFTPCLVAKHFQCVNRNDVVDICADTPAPRNHRYRYITSPSYPTPFTGGLHCSISVRIPSAKSVFVRMISSHLPPSCDEHLDYVEISTTDDHKYTLCGDVDYDRSVTRILSGEQLTVTFTSRQSAKTYQGFVLYYEFIEDNETSSATGDYCLHDKAFSSLTN